MKYLIILILVFTLFSCGPDLHAVDKVKKAHPGCDIYLAWMDDEFIAVCPDGGVYYLETDIHSIEINNKLKKIIGYEELIGDSE